MRQKQKIAIKEAGTSTILKIELGNKETRQEFQKNPGPILIKMYDN